MYPKPKTDQSVEEWKCLRHQLCLPSQDAERAASCFDGLSMTGDNSIIVTRRPFALSHVDA